MMVVVVTLKNKAPAIAQSQQHNNQHVFLLMRLDLSPSITKPLPPTTKPTNAMVNVKIKTWMGCSHHLQ